MLSHSRRSSKTDGCVSFDKAGASSYRRVDQVALKRHVRLKTARLNSLYDAAWHSNRKPSLEAEYQ